MRCHVFIIKMSIYNETFIPFNVIKQSHKWFLRWYFVYKIWHKKDKTLHIKLITSMNFELQWNIYPILWNMSSLSLLHAQNEFFTGI